LDGGDQGSFAVRAEGAHGARDRRRFRGADAPQRGNGHLSRTRPAPAMSAPSQSPDLLDAAVRAAKPSVTVLRAAVRDMFERLAAAFAAGVPVSELVHARARAVDELMQLAWRHHLDGSGAALVAVGGYGRGELHPAS